MIGAGCSHQKPWVEDEVTFVADGLTIHGTYRHQPGAPAAPAALLISESGMTDRNGDNAVAGPVGNMRQLAEYLSDHGVASLRYDKVGTGRTGLGPYAKHPADVGTAVFTAGAQAAFRFLADEAGVDKDRLSVYGLGEGTTHAMALATDTAADAPKIHSLGLLQPLPGRYLDLMTSRLRSQTEAAVKAGGKTPQQADGVLAAWTAAVAQARANGTVPPGQLPDGMSAISTRATSRPSSRPTPSTHWPKRPRSRQAPRCCSRARMPTSRPIVTTSSRWPRRWRTPR